MKSFNTVIKLSVLIALLAAVAAGSGLLWQGSGESYPFTTLRGETVLIRGHGLYRYDTVASSSQEIGQDIVTLLVGIPLLVYAMLRARKDAMRGKLLLTGGLAYFLYTYASMSFLTAFNAFFLVYVALFSLSLFAFILALMALDPAEVAAHIGERFPRRAITAYFLVVAAFLALAWLGLVVPPMLTGTAPAGLESAITMVIQVLDLGVIVPTAILTALLLRKGNAWGLHFVVGGAIEDPDHGRGAHLYDHGAAAFRRGGRPRSDGRFRRHQPERHHPGGYDLTHHPRLRLPILKKLSVT
jgi:hypothetical protein